MNLYQLALFYAKRNGIIIHGLSIEDEMKLQSLYNAHRHFDKLSHRKAVCVAVLEFWD